MSAMTVRAFIELMQTKPELLDHPLLHSSESSRFPYTVNLSVRDVYVEQGQVIVSGGGIPSNLPEGAWLTR